MNLRQLQYFKTIAELEHYTRAAEKLYVSQSNLSHSIQELEDSVMCVFILQLIGDDESIDKAEAEIDKNGVLRERLEVE